MKWAFKQQEATRQAKGHRKKERGRGAWGNEGGTTIADRQWMSPEGDFPCVSLPLSIFPFLFVYCLPPLHSSTYCCFVLVRPLCCSVYFETYSRCVMWFHFCPFVVVVSIVVALISQSDKEENSQRPPELGLQGDSSNCWRVAQEVLQAQQQLDLLENWFSKWTTDSQKLSLRFVSSTKVKLVSRKSLTNLTKDFKNLYLKKFVALFCAVNLIKTPLEPVQHWHKLFNTWTKLFCTEV